jgi:hypothetical protein
VSPTTSYCTILAQNYLPRALALANSLERHHPEAKLVVMLIDVPDDAALPHLPGVRCVSTSALGISEREVLDLAAGYNLVEFATAIKPLLLRSLLEESDQAVYLDPDTWVVSPMVELDGALAQSEGGIVLTPHFLEPLPEGALATEGHLLTVGIFNLGFCAVDRRSRPFLDWWWSHLKDECLHDPLSGLFVDQKWVDIGNTLFSASSLQHYGYNNGVLNLHERPLDVDGDGYFIATTGDRLRLFHFHSFDTSRPDELTTRFDPPTAHLREGSSALDLLCKQYAEELLGHQRALPPAPAYVYDTDTTGRRIARQIRRVHRRQVRAGRAVPSPYLAAEARAYARWRRKARREVLRDVVGDVAKAFRVLAPDEAKRIKKRVPGLTGRVRDRYVEDSGGWA